MASAQLLNNTGGEGASNTLIIPKISSERKRQELTDAIHYCIQLMIKNSLTISTASKETSILAKLIGQEMFFRIVKLIYEIKFNVSKKVVEAPKVNKHEASSSTASIQEDSGEIRVKEELPSSESSIEKESNIKAVDVNNTNPSIKNEKHSESNPISSQGIIEGPAGLNIFWEINTKGNPVEEASLYSGTSDKILNAARVENDKSNPVVAEPDPCFEHVGCDDLPFDEENKNLQENVVIGGDLKIFWEINAQEMEAEEASSVPVTNEVVLDESRIISDPLSQSLTSEESEVNDDDSSYSPSGDEIARPYPPIPLPVKEKIVKLAELNPGWSVKTLSRYSHRMRRKGDLKLWKEQLKRAQMSAADSEKFNLITDWVLEQAMKAKENSMPVTPKTLCRWGVEASKLYSVKGFKASKGWLQKIKKVIEGTF